MMRLLGVVLAMSLAGCGVYSVHVDPPPAAVLRAATPLDATVSLGTVRSWVDGAEERLPDDELAALDAAFVRAVSAAGIVRAAVPRGTASDLRLDVVRDVHAARNGADVAYDVFAGPLPFVAPGFPYPRRQRIARRLALHGDVAGTTLPLCTGETREEERVWSASYWGTEDAARRRDAEGASLAAALGRLIEQHRDALDDFSAAAHRGDVESAWLASDRTPPTD